MYIMLYTIRSIHSIYNIQHYIKMRWRMQNIDFLTIYIYLPNCNPLNLPSDIFLFAFKWSLSKRNISALHRFYDHENPQERCECLCICPISFVRPEGIIPSDMVLALLRCRTAISFIVAALLAHTPARSAMKGYKMILKKKYRFCLGCHNIKDFHLSVCSITRTQPIQAHQPIVLCTP